ncbi:hypothetical protein MTR_1g114115 [Medicago truncatula]|uniref:Uncharacterized protein n=1 Tax=Medicago truncatula TaxID=3880 RepID=A0A072VSN4_MEDTR|nr:hypothetical protein MTR_1g114115 [Medicago truncatula]
MHVVPTKASSPQHKEYNYTHRASSPQLKEQKLTGHQALNLNEYAWTQQLTTLDNFNNLYDSNILEQQLTTLQLRPTLAA